MDIDATGSASNNPTIATAPAVVNDFQRRSLYGGALSVMLPARFTDTSQFRHIPDHQEVFADADTDQSVIVELNEALDVTDSEAVMAHVRELADASDATDVNVIHTGSLDRASVPNAAFDHGSFAIAEMHVSKYRESAATANVIQVYFALLRLKNHTTDLCLIFNVPVKFSEGSVSAGRPIMDSDANAAVIQTALASLTINDYALFG